ncbi:GNAT family N-acetyltransferase [Dictyobacter aurantiacus]|uniref:N-acetyltransferase n=1 Tax=Dictyobacter aurantiacus TaxID=1936993 RepID=A0A401ZPI5_9CHLR|nr:GNAT family protein [Dictyobacter aurantiacus]GCE08771.1 N-acetyltransferase [Dictyobacter aurantiacus]
MMQIEPVTLTGNVVRLEPLQLSHAEDLLEAAQEPDTWWYMAFNPSTSLQAMRQWIDEAAQLQQSGSVLPFAIVDQRSGRAIGSTRYLAIMPKDYGLEIGWTWIAPAARRTGINTECKYLLLRHAFEQLHAIRVQLKTDSRNLRSQRAIERIGGVKEGVLRNHMIMLDGYYRHSVFYSIINTEWEQVKADLEEKIR